MKKYLYQKRAQVAALAPAVLALIFASIVLVFGLIILQSIKDTPMVVDGSNITITSINTTLVGLATFADFWEIIVLAVVIGIVIGLLLVVFGGRRGR